MNETSAREQFGERVRHYRELRGWDMDELARKFGKTKGTISRIETGKQNVNIWQVIRLADILRVPVEELFPEGSSLKKHEYRQEVAMTLRAMADQLEAVAS